MRPEIGFSTLKLLESAGCEVIVPEHQTCCGQPAWNSGDANTTLGLVEQFVNAFEPFEYIVMPSGSCAGMVKVHFMDVANNHPTLKTRVQALASRVYELTDFLYSVLKVSQLPQPITLSSLTVTYHDSCSGLRELGIQKQPRALLGMCAGITVQEMNDSRACCGFGGTFSLKYGDISSAICDEKCQQIADTQAQAVVLGDLGCMLNIEGRLRRTGDNTTRVLHVAQVLAGDLE
jgi:L-lactate dehydrogenase complex protein LldE